jgi:hypothetical protein
MPITFKKKAPEAPKIDADIDLPPAEKQALDPKTGKLLKVEQVVGPTKGKKKVKVVGKDAVAHSTITHKDGSKNEDTEVLGTVVSSEPMATVGVKAGYTSNLGNFESCRFDVSLYLPCKPSEIEDTYAFGKQWVDTKMSELMDDVKKMKDQG